jgi:hypothetical protein
MWTAEDWDIQRLKVMALSGWEKQHRIKLIDAVASYGRPALSALTDIAGFINDKELQEYALEKIKEINTAK